MSAYLVVNARVTNPELLDRYVQAAVPTIEGYECTPLVITNDAEAIEGQPVGARIVVLRFPSREVALKWYNSEAYQAVIGMRHDSTEGFAVIAEGLD
jgi:uncharacterized protein (DUF1330 family)